MLTGKQIFKKGIVTKVAKYVNRIHQNFSNTIDFNAIMRYNSRIITTTFLFI